MYSSSEEDFISANEETYKGLRHVRHVLSEKKATFVMDREYDNVEVMKKILDQGDNFIIRLKKNRHLIYQNKKLNVRDLALRRKGKINFQAKIKGKTYDLKVSHIEIEIPSLKGKKMTMVVVYGYGKDPMVLLTSKQAKRKDDVLSILKGYILRWRIEEMFRVQKQEFKLESVCVRTLNRLNRLLLFVSLMVTSMSKKTEKENNFFHVVIHRASGIKSPDKIRMFLYRFTTGMKAILEKDSVGIRRIADYHSPCRLSWKITLAHT